MVDIFVFFLIPFIFIVPYAISAVISEAITERVWKETGGINETFQVCLTAGLYIFFLVLIICFIITQIPGCVS